MCIHEPTNNFSFKGGLYALCLDHVDKPNNVLQLYKLNSVLKWSSLTKLFVQSLINFGLLSSLVVPKFNAIKFY